jgi:hypothetical protein
LRQAGAKGEYAHRPRLSLRTGQRDQAKPNYDLETDAHDRQF